jgi:uroporphyrin-III C-methyltransferase / precorrin-2 dehydrogenase / sirohydrochlorin ferrochelatase
MLPLFLRLEGKDALVVGAGAASEKKIKDLVEAGARVRVIAMSALASVKELSDRGSITLETRAFQPSDVEGAWLVVAATNDAATQKSICDAADAQRTFSIAIDDPPHGSAYSASVIRRGPVTVAISTSGEAPALSRLLREVLEQALPEADWIEAAKELRTKWKAEGTPMSSRFADLVRAFKEKAG